MRTILLVLAFAIPVTLCAQDPDGVRDQQAAPAVTAGKTQFQQTCGFCHGRDGRGASGPDLIRSALVSHDEQGELIAPVIRNGRPDKGMPAFQLSDKEIKDIAMFLHAEAKDAASVARSIPSDYPVEKLLTGNAEEGRSYFEANCKACHAASGDLAHVATKYKPFDLQTRIAFPSGVKPVLTVRDSFGKQFEGEEVYSDEFVVTLRDSQRWLHTWRRKDVRLEVKDPLAAHERLLENYTDKNIHDLFAYLETLK